MGSYPARVKRADLLPRARKCWCETLQQKECGKTALPELILQSTTWVNRGPIGFRYEESKIKRKAELAKTLASE